MRAYWIGAGTILCLGSLLAGPGTVTSHRLPLVFEEHGSRFVARGNGYSILLEGREWALIFPGGTVRATFVGANPAQSEGLEPFPGVANYFLPGRPPGRPVSVATYGRVRFGGIYPGVDLVCYGKQNRLEFDFVVAPGADPGRIRVRYDGAEAIELDSGGDLLLQTPAGELRMKKPFIYQEAEGTRLAVDGRYVLRGDGLVGFELGPHDASRPLVIDPVLEYSTYFGGKGNDGGSQIAVDAAGNVYVGGVTTGRNFPITEGAAQTEFAGMGPLIVTAGDAFVAKFSPSGELLYSTYIGGSDDDAVMALAVDGEGNVYAGGLTKSADFPTTPRAYRTTFGGVGQAIHTGGDGFVVKLSPDGKTMLYSTYIGGSDADTVMGLTVDEEGNVYVTGQTLSPNFPTSSQAFQRFNRGDGRAVLFKTGDAFVMKLDKNGARLVYSTLLGGTSDDCGLDIALDSERNAYVTGFTNSKDFPVTENAFQKTFGGTGGQATVVFGDAFVTKLNPDGSALVYSTYLGGKLDEIGYGIAVDSLGRAYVTGSALSDDFPATEGAFQTVNAGGGGDPNWSAGDVFVTKMNEDGSALLYSTFLGGSKDDRAFAIALDEDFRATVAGNTLSPDFPLTGDALQKEYAGGAGQPLSAFGDIFVTTLNATGSGLEFSTYLGTARDDFAFDVALGADGDIYVTGNTVTKNFPTTENAFSRDYSGFTPGPQGAVFGDAIWFRLDTRPRFVTLSSASFDVDGPVAPESLAAGFAEGVAPEVAVTPSTDLPQELLGVTVDVTDSEGTTRRARLHSVAPNQVNYEIPAGTAIGTAALRLTTADGRTIDGTVEIAQVAPGIYTANQQGTGVAAAFFLLVKANGDRIQDLIFDVNTRAPVPVSLGEEGDQLFLILFGTGMRHGSGATATIGGVDVPVAGPVAHSVFPGLDQVNLGPLPRALIGRGVVEIRLVVDGVEANVVTVEIQ